jgi:hypothetical protein
MKPPLNTLLFSCRKHFEAYYWTVRRNGTVTRYILKHTIEQSEETVRWLVTFWYGTGVGSGIYTFLPRSQVSGQESSIFYQVLVSVFTGQLFQDLEDRRAKTGQRVIPIEDNMTRRSEYDGVTERTGQLGKASLGHDSWTGILKRETVTGQWGQHGQKFLELNAFKFLWS